jgi:hypothetical protein
MFGKVKVAVDPSAVDGYNTKYWIGISNLEHVWVPQAILDCLPILGKAVWST